MNLLETIAKRELEGLMDIKIIGELDNRYLWVDICLAKIEYAYYHYLKGIYSKEKRVKIARDITWKLWFKTTDENYTRMIEGYNFDKKFIPVYQSNGIFIESYKTIYEKYVGSINDFTFYRRLFEQFFTEERWEGIKC